MNEIKNNGLEVEIFKVFDDGIHSFLVSNYGKIANIKTKKIYKLTKTKKGYLRITIGNGHLKKSYLAHRLVGYCFIKNPYNLPQINHVDEIKTNNYYKNLEWCNNIYNNNHGTKIERTKNKTTNGKCSKPIIQYDKSGICIKKWLSMSEAGRNGFTVSQISLCCSGKIKTHKGFIWKYEEM